ncbi:unnamed protein product [Ilex paraguariensis]|uniref:Uncharacterized protein n=1 Tax=Ilex paraguariensis TaxID=185542 RepID=A0ABC8STJ8_9AQUA
MQTVFEGDGGGYYSWSTSKSPLLVEAKLGAGKLLLHPRGFSLPHYADSAKIGYVLQVLIPLTQIVFSANVCCSIRA